LVDAVCRDPATAPISDKEKALFAYVERLNAAPASVTQGHADALKAVGWADDEIYDAVTVCALFNFFNRWIDGTGVPDTPPGFYDARLAQHGDRGYA
jgi:uncharacterized peroxidase-related enzyme